MVRGILEFFGRVKLSLKMQYFWRFFGFFGFFQNEKIGCEMGTQFWRILSFWTFLKNRGPKIVQKKSLFVHGSNFGPRSRCPGPGQNRPGAFLGAPIRPLV